MGHCEIMQKKVLAIIPAEEPNEKPRVELEDGSEIECNLLIGSDGEKSKTRSDY